MRMGERREEENERSESGRVMMRERENGKSKERSERKQKWRMRR